MSDFAAEVCFSESHSSFGPKALFDQQEIQERMVQLINLRYHEPINMT
jgi:hypothetical protein